MFTITKTREIYGIKYRLYIDDIIDNTAIILDSDDSHKIAFMNKPIDMSPHGNIYFDIQAFGIYSRSLTGNDIKKIYEHMTNENFKYLNIWKRVLDNIINRDNIINEQSGCPFIGNQKMCFEECRDVSKWTDISDIINNSTPVCRESIMSFCKNNKDLSVCKLFDESNVKNLFEIINKDEYDLLERCKNANGGKVSSLISDTAIDNIILDKTLRSQGLNSLELARQILRKYETDADDQIAQSGLIGFEDIDNITDNDLIDYNNLQSERENASIKKVTLGDGLEASEASNSKEIQYNEDVPLTEKEIEKLLKNEPSTTNLEDSSTFSIKNILGTLFT
jgi:hypothetical protein